jgi:hypothetical protein
LQSDKPGKFFLFFYCETENKPHDYEEIDDMSVFALLPQFTRIVGTEFRFGTLTDTNKVKPPQLPARIFSTTARSVSVSACTDKGSEDKFRERTISLPSFEKNKKNFPGLSDCNEEPFYNEPWDCKSNLTVFKSLNTCIFMVAICKNTAFTFGL